MAERKDIEGIIRLAAQAPSGDNSQPWRFEVHGDAIDIYNIPGKDYTPYNFRERGSLFAHGAVIENAVIAASSLGYRAVVALFPIANDRTCVARIALSKEANAKTDPLVASIEARATNRKSYRKVPLSSEHKDAILDAAQSAGFGKLSVAEDRRDITMFAKTVSLSDRLIFEEKMIHDAIFHAIRWSRKEEEERKGLYVMTMELPPPARLVLKAAKSWSTLTKMNKVGISRFIASQAAKGYGAASAVGMLTIPDDSDESFVKAGRTFQRIWLTATRLGVGIQPVTALAYLDQKARAGEASDITPEHAAQVQDAQSRIRSLFGDPGGTVAMMFRMGYGKPPSARSQKSEPQVSYKN